MAAMRSISSGSKRCNAACGPGVPSAKPKPWRSCACQRTIRRWAITSIAQLRRAETPWSWEVAITIRMACLVAAGSQVPAIAPTNPHWFFPQDGQFDRLVGQRAFFFLQLRLEFIVRFGADHLPLAAGLCPQPQQGAF